MSCSSSKQRKNSHDSKAEYFESIVTKATNRKHPIKIVIDDVCLEISPGDNPQAVLKIFKAAIQTRQQNSRDFDRQMKIRLKQNLENAFSI